jgi:hypothetical protein
LAAVPKTIRLLNGGSHQIKEAGRRQERGFSLPEIAIVLFLVWIFVGAIVLGHGMVTQARVRSLSNDFTGLALAVATYADRYGALPGDDPRAEIRWAGRAKNGTGDSRISGSYEATPPAGDPLTALTVDGTSGESLNFWWHLRLADLVPSPPSTVTQVAQPLDQYSGVFGVEWGVLGFPGLTVCAANIPGDAAIGIENRLDNGNPRQGSVRVAKQTFDNQPLATADATVTAFVASARYIVCLRLD